MQMILAAGVMALLTQPVNTTRVRDDLLCAIIQVESKWAPNAVGDRGRAVGLLQIHRVMVDDCNRICDEMRFRYHDRQDPQKSIEMYYIFMDHYCKGMTDEQKARCWNGGPEGWQKESTKEYWRKVSHQLKLLK